MALLFSDVLVNWKLSKISLDENSGRLITVLVQKLSLIQNRFIGIVEPQRLYACTRLRSRRRLFEGGTEREISRANGGKRGGVVPWRSNRKKEPTPAMQGFACLVRSVPDTQRREFLLPLGVDCDCTNTSVTIFRACVASVSSRGSSRKLGQEQKKIKDGGGGGGGERKLSRNNSIGNACYAGYNFSQLVALLID